MSVVAQKEAEAGSFLLRASERGHDRLISTGPTSSYIGGHPEAVLTRESSFNFGPYQEGRSGFGRIRVFGEETFSGLGCGYNIHPHHNFIICAFVLQGQLTHVNTLGWVDEVRAGDYYAFSAGSGGKHAELSILPEGLHVIYIWFLPDKLLLPPSYKKQHFTDTFDRNTITELVGDGDGAIPIEQDVRVSRLVGHTSGSFSYQPRTSSHGVYTFVISGQLASAGAQLGPGDSMGSWGTEEVVYETATGADALVVETVL